MDESVGTEIATIWSLPEHSTDGKLITERGSPFLLLDRSMSSQILPRTEQRAISRGLPHSGPTSAFISQMSAYLPDDWYLSI